MKRIVQPELLDTLSPDDPRAVRSRRDLRRINWWMRNHAIMAAALRSNLPSAPGQITELGAGDGNFLLAVAGKISPHWPAVHVTLLDLQKNVSAKTLAAFANLGWRAEAVVADVFNWPKIEAEIVIANLFLHHFEDARLAELLQKISRHAKLFIAVEPQWFRRALACASGRDRVHVLHRKQLTMRQIGSCTKSPRSSCREAGSRARAHTPIPASEKTNRRGPS